MACITATGRETVQPDPGHPQPAALAGWPLRAGLDLGAVPTAPSCGRAWIRQILWEWRLTRLTDSAELIASELLTNALLASRWLDRPVIELTLLSDGQCAVILVRDFNPGTPAPRHASAEDESGRGLMLVEAISDQSGWYQPADEAPGKVVWAAIALSPGQADQSHRSSQLIEGVSPAMATPVRHSTGAFQEPGRQDPTRELVPAMPCVPAPVLPSRSALAGVRVLRRVPVGPDTLRRVRAALGRL